MILEQSEVFIIRTYSRLFRPLLNLGLLSSRYCGPLNHSYLATTSNRMEGAEELAEARN